MALSLGAVIDELVAFGAARELSDGAVLCRQGDEGGSAYVVTSGRLETIVSTATGDIAVAGHETGALVGEITALVGGRRNATLRSDGPTTVAEVSTSDLRRVFDRHPSLEAEVTAAARDRSDRSRVAELLAQELGANDRAAIADIAERVTWRSLPAGQVLFEAGEAADGAYIVLSGRVAVDNADGRRFVVGRGAVVGEFGLLEDKPRTATVTARRDSSLARIDHDDFAALTLEHSGLAMGLVRRIVQRSGRESSAVTRLGRSVCIVTTDGLDGRAIATGMASALEPLGSTAHLGGDDIDTRLGSPGSADVGPGEVGDVRLDELLHQVDIDHDHLILEADLARPQWTATALRRVDQVVIVTSADPTPAQEQQIRAVQGQTPDGTPVWLALDHTGADGVANGSTAVILDRFGADEVHHIMAANQQDLARVGRLALGRGNALVLSGGGARGFAHIGVMRSLDEVGVPIDRFVGASMGAAVGSVFAQGFDHPTRLAMARRQFRRLLDYTLPLVSLLKGERITQSIRDVAAGRDIEDSWTSFACVATDLTNSEVVSLRRGPLDVALRASTAIPGVLPPVPADGHLLVDGGVLNNLPIELVADDPTVDTIIAVDVAPPSGPGAEDDFGLSVSGWSALWSRIGRGRARYPTISPVLMRTMLIASARDRDVAIRSGMADLYLDLELEGIGLLELDRVDEVAELGYQASKDRIAQWWRERASDRQAINSTVGSTIAAQPTPSPG